MTAKTAKRAETVALAPLDVPANETEQRLLDCALSLFAEKGYSATSVREIIEAAGVTRPVLYYYAESKEDLFKRVVRWAHGRAYAEFAALASGTSSGRKGVSAANRLRELARGSFTFCAADPRIPRLMFQSTYGPSIPELSSFLYEFAAIRFGIVQSVMQAGLDAGELRGGDAASLALVYCCVIDQHLNVLSRLPEPQRRLTPALADALVDLFIGGAGASGKRPLASLPPFVGA